MKNVAIELEKITGFSVMPCGIMHSHKVDTSKLQGQPGMSLESFFLSKEAEVAKKLSFVPMFIGPSLAITDWLPEKLTEWSQNGNERKFSIADCIYKKKDDRIAKALTEYVVDLIPQFIPVKPFLILVDHGTPILEVNLVREEIGYLLEKKLANQISGFSTACMERREGTQYDFNDPLLEIAMELEKIALKDDYFIEKKLYPNVDFYSGIILKAMGFPTDMFTVLFAVARTVGWVAQWNEMITDPVQRIGRPRQLYTGNTIRDYVELKNR